MFPGQTVFMLISVPAFSPLSQAMGFEAVWFWMLYLINIRTGGMTPPFDMTMFVFKVVVPDMSVTDIYHSTWLHVLVIVFGIAVMSIFPRIVLVLPRFRAEAATWTVSGQGRSSSLPMMRPCSIISWALRASESGRTPSICG